MIANIIGLIAGDGNFSYSGRPPRSLVRIDIWGQDKERLAAQIEPVINDIRESVKPSLPTVAFKPEGERLRLRSTWLASWFNKEYGFNKTTKLIIPHRIKHEGLVTEYLSGLFYADGHISKMGIILAQSNVYLLEQVQEELIKFDIPSRIYLKRKAHQRSLPDGRGGMKLYSCKEQYELVVMRNQAKKDFMEQIGFWNHPRNSTSDKMGFSSRLYAHSQGKTWLSHQGMS